MTNPQEFEHALMRLDPNEPDFVQRVDELVAGVPESVHSALIEPIFRFFEAHPLSDAGAPGTLVHLTEQFYPTYKDRLLESLRNRPSHNAILMTNRILNSRLSHEDRSAYMSALDDVSERNGLPASLQSLVDGFLKRRRTLDAQS